MANTITAFAAAIAAAQQQNFLQRTAEEGLDSNLAWRRLATKERIPAGIGQTMTMTRKSRVAPIVTPATPQSVIPSDTASAQFTIEQYTLTMYDWQGAPGQVDAVQNQAGIFDQLLAVSRNSGVQASQSRERAAQTALYNAYLSANTRVRVDLGAGSTTSCHVDDIRGFQNVLVNGVVTALGGGVTMTVQETAATAGGVTQTLTVTAVTSDAPSNFTTTPGGQSGSITFSAATTPVGGDQLLGQNNPTIIRPNGRLTTAQLTGGDFMTVQMLLDMKAQLENNAVPMFNDGFYELIADPTTIRQLFADQDFKVYFAGREQSDEVRKGFVSTLFGIRITPTTEALVQGPSSHAANGYTDAVNVKVARPMMVGAEALIEGTFQGLDNYLRDLQGNPGVVHAEQVDDIVQLCRYPTDMYGRWYTFAWDWIGGYAVPTDLTATAAIIPTSNSSLFKRAIVAEIAIG